MSEKNVNDVIAPRSVDQQQACSAYLEDWAVCDDTGEPKGQCSHCGYKWYDHALDALPENERESAARIQAERCLPNDKTEPRL